MPLKISQSPPIDLMAEAFDTCADEMRALPEAKVIRRLNVDPSVAVSVILGALPGLQPLRDAMCKQLPDTPVHRIDALETYCYAALHVYTASLTTTDAERDIVALMAEATPLRKRLLMDAVPAAERGLLDAEGLDQVPRGIGRFDVARALLALGALFREGWSKLKGRTAVTDAELQQATKLGVDLLAALGHEDQSPAPTREVLALRMRAYSLLLDTWDECRRAVTYLRWHEDDVADFTPALTGPRGPRARKDDSTEEPDTKPEDSAATPPKDHKPR